MDADDCERRVADLKREVEAWRRRAFETLAELNRFMSRGVAWQLLHLAAWLCVLFLLARR